ncbi:MAG TPA: glucose-6-phosphate isomerase [Methylophilaceae bacterium]|jgi:glucose-6-phosphate isomerase|nr:glucose-6-phosphate isomerase [Methylophilaceae bacterium]HAP04190.1 glucose-6-phosphate isomerase [Methylophilaceae bacterium]HBO18568.1 glucose-6-phosphate isomerase [Methylophilaceae bacterium]HCC72156.1 glucose-6-phosphate isomerase [Methylophilaceae bacterium]
MSQINQSPIWQSLIQHKKDIETISLREMFKSNPDRFNHFHIQFNDLLLDYSKHRVSRETIGLLVKLAKEADVEGWRNRMFEGEKINSTEHRAVLHTALRNQKEIPIISDGEDVMPKVKNVLKKMRRFSEDVRSGQWKGFTGKAITSVINIGIGGSDLGPAMVCQALKAYGSKTITPYFVSNVDGADLSQTLEKCSPETTLFIIASKTFTTQETMTNAFSARDWFLKAAKDNQHIKKHFVALSTNQHAVSQFGIDIENMFEFWDWVGGRYSLWSAIGLSIALYIGMDGFEELLKGGFEMDEHFKTAPIEQNIPMMMGLLGVWYINFFNFPTHAILAYDQGLSKLAPYLQQADMESNGKFINREGERIDFHTGPVIWGEIGTNGQHAFYQLLHQGTEIVPADFIMPIQSQYKLGKDGNEHHKILLSNFIAQTQSLMLGKTYNEARTEIEKQGYEGEDIESFIPQKTFEGNRPTSSILFKKLTPKTLGQIIAMYEHKIFTQGIIWNINSFDQWGVEYGKQIAKQVLPKLSEKAPTDNFDSSTNGLINYIKKYQ